jgi:hypothetical protein
VTRWGRALDRDERPASAPPSRRCTPPVGASSSSTRARARRSPGSARSRTRSACATRSTPTTSRRSTTRRRLLRDGRRPLGVGFFFSLGRSTVVFGLVACLTVAARTAGPALPGFGRYVGAGVSGTFLCVIGVLNLLVLLDVVRIFGRMRTGTYDRERLEQRLADRGLMSRFFLGGLSGRIRSSWHMYPTGLLFGLGFDTATEVGLLAISAGVATGEAPVRPCCRCRSCSLRACPCSTPPTGRS